MERNFSSASLGKSRVKAMGRPVTPYLEPPNTNTLSRRPNVLVAACGSVAAIKLGNLCRCFCGWAEVKAVATNAALRFIDINTIPYEVVLYSDEDDRGSWKKLGDSVLHIDLCKWADVLVIAPLSANTLGKIAGGLCDNLVTCIVRAWNHDEKAIFVAPSMNTHMWKNLLTEQHLESIDELGISLIVPNTKVMSTGGYGNGAMAEITLIDNTIRLFLEAHPPSSGSNA